MSLRKHLEAIYEKHGSLTPQIVLAEARKKSHPLHDEFTWDNAEAGEKLRLIEAHELIVSVKHVFRSEKDPQLNKSLRVFHAVRSAEETDNGGYRYEPLNKIVSDPELTSIVLKDMEREWKTLRRRYDDFTEFWEMIKRDVAA